MKPRRADRVGEQVRQEIALLLLHESKDPGTSGVVVTSVRLTDDLGTARVNFVLQDPSRDRKEAEKALERAAGFLRARLRERLSLRITPTLHFHYDVGLEHGRRVEELLGEIAAQVPGKVRE